MAAPLTSYRYVPAEWSYRSSRQYSDPFWQVTLDVLVTDPSGTEYRVPAFWAGEDEWRVRFSPRTLGTHTLRSICSDPDDVGLHDHLGTLLCQPYDGANPLQLHGPLLVDPARRTLQHADGTPFFWLGDTWWMGLSKRLTWPDEFQALVADRVAKGFSVIQIVAGFYPDMHAYDPRNQNEAGFPWGPAYAGINPAYWDMADLRIRWLVRQGMVPCMVGGWGYHVLWMGVERTKQHWRHLVARYGAYPVVWCLAGEGGMPYYLSTDREGDNAELKRRWTEVAGYLRQVDPYHHPITIHPQQTARDTLLDERLLDLDMLQTGHSGHLSIPNTVDTVRAAVARQPRMPVIEGEVCYEGILEGSREEIQRFMFWACMLSGVAGYTYGANGLWQLNRAGDLYGPSPHGVSWGDRLYWEAAQLPGSSQVGVGRRILEGYPWWRFEAHPEWVHPSASAADYYAAYAAGIPREVRVVYYPRHVAPRAAPACIVGLEPDVRYTAAFMDPKDGHRLELGEVGSTGGEPWRVPIAPVRQDWLLVLEAR